MRKLIILLTIALTTLSAQSQERTAAFEMNRRLGRGINMGNAFEAPTETAWGNQWKPEYFKYMADLGFKHVRVPVRWEPADRSLSTAPYTIYPTFLNRMKQVVDAALKNKLHIVFNMHHHDALFANPAAQKERFLSQWRQIGEFFKSYPDSLLFEVLNEPNGELTAELWNEYFPAALAEIRKTNPTRTVLLGVAEWGGLGALSKLQVPADENLILTIHYYNPFQFTHQGAEWSGEQAQSWLGTKWLDSEADREVIQNEFKVAKSFGTTHKIPVHIGEFGAYSKADIESRERWTTYLARWFEEQGFSWAYWEFSAGFGIYNPTTKQYLTPLVNALLHNTIPEPARVEATQVYKSNFTSSNDGWSLSASGGAQASLIRSGGKLSVNISNGGSQGWHVQLVRNNISLQTGKTYRVTFKASAPTARSFTAYSGKASDPWNSYSGYNSFYVTPAEDAYSYVFTMTATDNAARMVFDLGNVSSGISVYDIRLESIVVIPTGLDLSQMPDFAFYPNPVENQFFINNNGQFSTASILSLTGARLASFPLVHGLNSYSSAGLKSGMYLLELSGENRRGTLKFIKK
jgi:endoglucanase